jgi:hypothetical protein
MILVTYLAHRLVFEWVLATAPEQSPLVPGLITQLVITAVFVVAILRIQPIMVAARPLVATTAARASTLRQRTLALNIAVLILWVVAWGWYAI